MKIEVKALMDDNEMLSHIFLGCMSNEEVIKVRDKYVNGKDWKVESVTVPVEMKIGGINVNPKEFFDQWKLQMQGLIQEEAKKIVAREVGSEKVMLLQNRLNDIGEILYGFEQEINWEAPNIFLETK